MQDQSVKYRMQKGTWARRTGSGAAGVWVGGWVGAFECHQPLRRKRNPGEGGGRGLLRCRHLPPPRAPAQSCHIVCGQARERGNGAGAVGGGGAFGLPLACSGVWASSTHRKNGRGVPQVRCRPPRSQARPQRCCRCAVPWTTDAGWVHPGGASALMSLQGFADCSAKVRSWPQGFRPVKSQLLWWSADVRGSWPWQPLPGPPKRIGENRCYFAGSL